MPGAGPEVGRGLGACRIRHHSAEPLTTITGRHWACKVSARDGAGCGLPDEPPDAWPACPVVWEGAGDPPSTRSMVAHIKGAAGGDTLALAAMLARSVPGIIGVRVNPDEEPT